MEEPSTTLNKLQTLADFLGVDRPEPATADEDVAPVKLTIKQLCRGILESREYKRSILQRVALGTLPPAVELRLYDYAHGKPLDRVELVDKRNPYQGLPASEIAEHLQKLADLARSLSGEAGESPSDQVRVH